METTKRRSDAFPYQVFPFLETQTMPGGSKFNAKKGSILLDNLQAVHPDGVFAFFDEVGGVGVDHSFRTGNI